MGGVVVLMREEEVFVWGLEEGEQHLATLSLWGESGMIIVIVSILCGGTENQL